MCITSIELCLYFYITSEQEMYICIFSNISNESQISYKSSNMWSIKWRMVNAQAERFDNRWEFYNLFYEEHTVYWYKMWIQYYFKLNSMKDDGLTHCSRSENICIIAANIKSLENRLV